MGRRFMTTAAVTSLLLAGAGAAGVYTAGSAQGPDILPALLEEVRGLRAAMEQMASAGPRVQLALGRLQLQEQRVNTLVRRLEETRDRLAEAQREAVRHEGQMNQMKKFDTMLKDGTAEARQEANEMQHMVEMFKREMAMAHADVQRLSAEEAAIAADIAMEQGRWTEINQRVEELERTLGRR